MEMQCWVPRLCLTFRVNIICHQWLHMLQALTIFIIYSSLLCIMASVHSDFIYKVYRCQWLQGLVILVWMKGSLVWVWVLLL